jgi:hypothetical protein
MKKTALIMSAALLMSGPALAGDKMYEVTITNITKGQIFTPILAVTHTREASLFELGSAASSELEQLAEGGATAPLQDLLDSLPGVVKDTQATGGLLMPGDSVTLEIEGRQYRNKLSFAAMLLPTHDTFVSIDSMELPRWSSEALAYAYDAGTELNTELCVEIPGPDCMGEGYVAGGGEGYVFISNGIHGIADLDSDAYDWRGAVAKVEVRRLK